MASDNTTSTRTLDALNDTEQADMMLTTPDSSNFGATVEESDSARSSRPSAVDQTDAEIEMIPVDGTERQPSTPVVVDMDRSTGVLPLAMPLSLASPSVASSVPGTPSASSTPGSYRSNRRARVDDDDDERDRRHPSQRISSSASGTPIPPPYPNTHASSSFTASNFPMFTHMPPFAGQSGGAVNPSDVPVPVQPPPLGSFFSGFFSAGGTGTVPRPSGLHNNNGAPVAHPNGANSSTATPGPTSGSGSSVSPNVHTPQSQLHSHQGQDQQQPQNGSNNSNGPPVQVFDYEFSFVVDQDGARPVQVHQRGGQGRQQQVPLAPPNGSPLGQQTLVSAPNAGTDGQQHTQPHPQSQQQQQPPQHPQPQAFPDALPQMPHPPAAPGVPGAGPIPNHPFPIPPNLAANLASIFTIPFGFVGAGGFTFGPPLEEKEDTERARKLIEGLEKVPVGLVRRLERVGKGGGMGEEEGKGGDAGCAVCWERLLETEGTVVIGKEEEDEKMVVDDDVTPTRKEPSKSTHTHPTIVALPCAHVFHADCLIPWFSRPKHTTCPTCRFNIDPENLTYVSAGTRRREERERRRQEGAAEADVDADTNTNDDEAGNAREDTPAPVGVEIDDEGRQAQAQNQQPQQLQNGFDFGAAEGGFAGLLQMLNAQTDTRGQAPIAATMGAGGAAQPGDPSHQPQPQGQGQHMHMPMPMPFMSIPGPNFGVAPNPNPNVQPGPVGNTSTPNPAPNPNPGAAPGAGRPQPQYPGFPPGMGVGLGMQAFTIPVAGGVMFGGPMPMPWGVPGFGGSRDNANAGSAPAAAPDDAAAPPTNNPDPANVSSFNASSAQQTQPSYPSAGQNQGQGQRPNFMADVLRVTVDMVFEGPRLSQGGQVAQRQQQQALSDGHNEPDAEGEDHGADTHDHDNEFDDEYDEEGMMPDLIESVDAEGRHLQELVDLIMRGRGPSAGNANATGSENGAANAGQQQDEASQPQQQEQSLPQIPHPPPPTIPPGPNQTMPMPNPNFQNLGGGIRVATGSGRSIGEAFAQMFSSFQQRMGAAPEQAGQVDQDQQPTADGAQPQPQQQPGQARGQNQGQARPQQQQQQQQPHAWQFIPVPLPDFEFPMRPPRAQGPKRPWAPPPAPGPTLRQRIERREREGGLRCHDISCGLGPSDEDPLAGELGDVRRKASQLAIMGKVVKGKDDNGGGESERKPVCEHLFHGSCLVSAERVKLRGAEAVAGVDGGVEVSCPVCRGVGCVTKEQWEEGVGALQ